jgi:hypothetical protein
MLLMHTKTILTIFTILTALGFIVIATSLATQASATGFGITLCSSLDTVGGKACLPTDKAPSSVGLTR